ncbi:MAG: Unknown protein [uncultured Campylobacterales bacterium]|uniref:Uncharacterized protein n=1 Tax=uncultured Campylobacterales bacterium TaxID=352960 RepID=A0A6S6T3Z6_9BACT|nr:MAG: Unknown protein [uncultured Campylobacterales bacterium]
MYSFEIEKKVQGKESKNSLFIYIVSFCCLGALCIGYFFFDMQNSSNKEAISNEEISYKKQSIRKIDEEIKEIDSKNKIINAVNTNNLMILKKLSLIPQKDIISISIKEKSIEVKGKDINQSGLLYKAKLDEVFLNTRYTKEDNETFLIEVYE